MVRFDGQETATNRPAEEVDTESDGESDSMGNGEGVPVFGQNSVGEEGEQARAILTPGSFAA